MARKQYDWEAIEKAFRAGVLSIREIASQHDCSDTAIRKRMKALGVERDLTERVKEKVRTELVREQVRTADPLTEKEIVEHAAATQVEVVRSHRTRIGATAKVVETLLGQLQETAERREEIEDAIISETAEGTNPASRNMMLKAVALPSHASVVTNLTNSLKMLVALERQAFGIVDDDGGNKIEKTLKDIVGAIDGQSKGLPSE